MCNSVFKSKQKDTETLDTQLILLNQLLVTSKRIMKTTQLYRTGCLKNVLKFDLDYLIVLALSMLLNGLLIELKALLEAK